MRSIAQIETLHKWRAREYNLILNERKQFTVIS